MNLRRTKKLLGDVYSEKRFTLRQKVVLRKTWSIFTVSRMAKHYEAQA